MKTGTPQTENVPAVVQPPLVLPLRERLDALSEDAKQWLCKSCHRFADGQGYEKWPEAITECLAAGLIEKRRQWIEIDADVMELVYSESYFLRQNP
jgi:hypothetical protein